MNLTLSEEQSLAVSTIFNWFSSDKKQFSLGGYAGTGKTTVIKAILEQAKQQGIDCAVAAFTGKAVNVLQRKDIREAQTLHSLIYDCVPRKDGGMDFIRKQRLEEDNDLIIVDEASMVSTDLYSDLKLFNKKLLFVGDPGQLEPVGDNPNLMAIPNFVLNKIHRQAENSPIITLANDIRLGAPLKLKPKSNGLGVILKSDYRIPDAAEYNQIICAKNATKAKVNAGYRKYLIRPMNEIMVGDKLIVLRNNPAFGVFNGMIVFITEIHKDESRPAYWTCTLKDEVNRVYPRVPIWKEPYLRDLGKEVFPPCIDGYKGPKVVYSDFGYCITCHKSQGSEWDKVLVWDEWMPPSVWDMKRWRYTAITRAAKELTVCL
jgi:exodeoxyribonuclease-5